MRGCPGIRVTRSAQATRAKRSAILGDRGSAHHCVAAGATAAIFGVDAGTSCLGCGYQPSTSSITKKPMTYATATCQPPRTQAIASLASAYMLHSPTPAEDPDEII